LSDRNGRIPLLEPQQLTEEQRDLYDRIAGGPRATGPFSLTDAHGGLLGPFNALLRNPGVGGAIERLGAALRFHGDLDAKVRELVICAVAAHWRSDFEWYAHSRVASEVGIDDAHLDAVWERRIPEGLSGPEDSALRLARSVLDDHVVREEVYDAAVEHHGSAGVVEICAVVGYYQLLAGLLATFDVPAPADEEGA
jgi:4-carboxymuconolactone decarboxylase